MAVHPADSPDSPPPSGPADTPLPGGTSRPPYDLVVAGGLLVDPEAGTRRPGDLAVRGGRIARIAPPGALSGTRSGEGAALASAPAPAPLAREHLDATGLLVAPGLIDLHTHVHAARTEIGLDPDAAGARRGVPTVVDAGSCGSDGWAEFAAGAAAADTRVLAWLNVSRHGLTRGHRELAGGAGDIDAGATLALLCGEPAIRGLKVRMSRSVLGGSGLSPLRTAKRLAARAREETGRRCPVMVHVGNEPPALGEVLDLLGEGDVVTHAFHGKPGGLFGGPDGVRRSDSGTPLPLPQVREALDRGVRFDVGHGSASFSFDTAERALAAGIRPYTISTDLHARNAHAPVRSLTATLGKLLALGMPLPEVLAAATVNAAEVLGQEGESGTLRAGARADLSLLRLCEGPEELCDAQQPPGARTAERLLRPHRAVVAGRPLPPVPEPGRGRARDGP